MTIINPEILNRRYNQLYEVTVRKSSYNDYGTTEISFSAGLWKEQEWYKRDIWNAARKILELEKWEEHRNDPQFIIKRVTDTMYAADNGLEDQNLVSFENARTFFELAENSQKVSDILYRIFMTDQDEESFNNLSAFLNPKKIHDPISIAAYLFFLKDPKKYVPAKQEGTEKRLGMLNKNSGLLRKCSWESYSEYLAIVSEIQVFLINKGYDAEFLDAQSFLWMLHMLKDNPPEYMFEPLDEDETAVSISRSEGRKTEYYVKRYERNPRNRYDAIRIHGTKCMACGFDFKEKYGELGDGFIEVHHVVPLSSLNEEVIVNPVTDLVCLCANCHRMIHRKKNAIVTVEELKKLIG